MPIFTDTELRVVLGLVRSQMRTYDEYKASFKDGTEPPRYERSGNIRMTSIEEKIVEYLGIDREKEAKERADSDERLRVSSHCYPPGFQVLCHNCNFGKSLYGVCPHQRETNVEYRTGSGQ